MRRKRLTAISSHIETLKPESRPQMHALSDLEIQKPEPIVNKSDDMQQLGPKVLRHCFKVIAPYFWGPKHQDIWSIGRFITKIIGKSTIDAKCRDGSWLCFPLPVYTMYFLHGVDLKKYGVGNLTPIFRKNISSGTVAIDVGASCGQEIIELSKAVGEDGIVYAFEPSTSFLALTRTVALNGLQNVICVNAGCGNENGYIDEDKEQAYVIGESIKYAEKGTPIVRIDDFLELIGEERPVSLIKIDTDGFELEVVQGAKKRISSSETTVIAEFEKHFNYSGYQAQDVLKKYADLGFSIEKLQTMSTVVSETEFDNYLSDIDDPANMIAHDIVLRPTQSSQR